MVSSTAFQATHSSCWFEGDPPYPPNNPIPHIPQKPSVLWLMGLGSWVEANGLALTRCASYEFKSILFLDEIDSLATSRNGEMHEATRRVLGVLLRQLDGFDQSSRSVVIAATNRKQDLDSALMSRFDSAIYFGLPDESCRFAILQKYAKHLREGELRDLAKLADGMSGRDLRDVCLMAERQWASKIVRKEVEWSLPPYPEYASSIEHRRKVTR